MCIETESKKDIKYVSSTGTQTHVTHKFSNAREILKHAKGVLDETVHGGGGCRKKSKTKSKLKTKSKSKLKSKKKLKK